MSRNKQLSASQWAAHYNMNQLEHLINSINNRQYYVQTAEMLNIVQAGEKTLEIGSGTGQTSLVLARLNGMGGDVWQRF